MNELKGGDHGACACPLCTSTEVKIRQAAMENKMLETTIRYPTPEVKVQVMAGTKAIQKIDMIRVTPDTSARLGLI